MPPTFIFVVCQNGAEAACKSEILQNHPELKVAFSRPGFLTFKDADNSLPEKFVLKSTFARTFGWTLGSLKSEKFQDQMEKLKEYSNQLSACSNLHAWQRDTRIPGQSGFEPGPTELSQFSGQETIRELGIEGIRLNRPAKSDEQVFDILMVEPDYWFFGFHFAGTRFQRWPGGAPLIDSGHTVISRAYYKLKEALLWSGIHINQGDVCAEIGSSPGGACQLLLEQNATVIAVDPAELDPEIATHENLIHLRCRGKEVRKKDLAEVRWLLSDTNVAPNYTLDTVEEIVNNQHVKKIRGLILTLKLADFQLANEIPSWVERVRGLGFQLVKTRQLAFNRREICLIALRDKFALRASKRPKK